MYIHYHSDDTLRRRQISCSMRGPNRGGRRRRRGTTDYGRRESTRALRLATSAFPLYDLCCFFSPHAIPAMHDSPPFGHITRHGHAIDHTTTHARAQEREKAAGGREKSPRDSLPSQHLQNRIHRIELPCSCFHIGLQSFEVLTDMSSAMIRPYMPSADAVPWMSTIPT